MAKSRSLHNEHGEYITVCTFNFNLFYLYQIHQYNLHTCTYIFFFIHLKVSIVLSIFIHGPIINILANQVVFKWDLHIHTLLQLICRRVELRMAVYK